MPFKASTASSDTSQRDGNLVVPTMTKDIWDKCLVPDKDVVFSPHKWGHSTWSKCLREKRIICFNEPSVDMPEGHIPIDRHLSLPIIFKGESIGLFQVANKDTDYEDEDLTQLESIANYLAPILHARLNREREEKKRRRAELALKRSNEELQQFAYIASHDLREPLRKISGFAELLGKGYRGQIDEKADRYIHYVVDGAHRMEKLINDLLTFSRLSRAELAREPVNLESVLEITLNDLGKSLKEAECEVTYDPLPTVQANSTQMGQLLQNLLGNAVKFRSDDPPRVHVSAQMRNHEWLISVRDNGIGLDMEHAQRIFDIFQRLHGIGEYDGTGIGLAVCKKIVERHGGQLWVDSEPGKGSTFSFTIPEP